jgi:general secretion pathway protein K
VIPARLRDRRGVALALVLWVIVILGAVGLGIVGAARSQLDVARTLRASAVARYAAESGVEEARARYRELLASASAGAGEAGAFGRLAEELERAGDRELGEARYRVAVLDLGARVDLNASSDEVLLALFTELAGDRRAASLLDALRDWTDADDDPLPRGA